MLGLQKNYHIKNYHVNVMTLDSMHRRNLKVGCDWLLSHWFTAPILMLTTRYKVTSNVHIWLLTHAYIKCHGRFTISILFTCSNSGYQASLLGVQGTPRRDQGTDPCTCLTWISTHAGGPARHTGDQHDTLGTSTDTLGASRPLVLLNGLGLNIDPNLELSLNSGLSDLLGAH